MVRRGSAPSAAVSENDSRYEPPPVLCVNVSGRQVNHTFLETLSRTLESTGFSNLSYLSRLPLDRLKVDKSLIQRMTSDPKTAAIVRSVISLGEDIGFAVLAEGVETEDGSIHAN